LTITLVYSRLLTVVAYLTLKELQMAFMPNDPTKFRPTKILFRVDTLREADRAVQEGLGGYSNRHELVNDLVEQGLIDLRYPNGESPATPKALAEAENKVGATSNGNGDAAAVEAPILNEPPKEMPKVEPLGDVSETRIMAPAKTGAVVENELGALNHWPLFGMHNRDAPTAWALARLAEEAAEGPIPLEAFYDKITGEAWTLAAQLQTLETKGRPKLAVMLPRNPAKPQSAAVGFRAFALGSVARKPNDAGKLGASGPFFQWGAVGLVGEIREPKIGLTESGWEVVQIFDGLDFSIPHPKEMAERFLAYLEKHAPADLWGFHTALEGAANGDGRIQLNEYFRKRLDSDYPDVEWKESVADSVASGYVSRARAWGLIEPKLKDGKYSLESAGEKTLKKFAATSKT
jgi:hypothetical protein